MKEKLTIRNFGPIKNVELELGRFNVLIGEQATGKSTVAKVLAVCRYFSYITQNGYPSLNDDFEEGLQLWGLSEFIQDNSFIKYYCKHYTFSAERVFDAYINPETGEKDGGRHVFETNIESNSIEFEILLKEFQKIRPDKFSQSLLNVQWKPSTSFYKNDVAKVMDNPFYLSTDRGLQSIFSLGKSSIQNLSDSLFNQFARMSQIEGFFKNETQIEPLNITYKNVDGKGFVRKNNEDKFYSLYNAASGYQSTIPVVLLIKYYTELKKKSKTFIIEEPELSLFPSAQNELVKFMAYKTLNYGNSLFLNTHSPYILTSLNNLMYAYQLGKENSEKVEEVLEKKYWVNPDEVSAYMMLPDGKCEDIFDRAESMIRAEKIDGVSRILNEDFDKLINIELGTTKPEEASWQD